MRFEDSSADVHLREREDKAINSTDESVPSGQNPKARRYWFRFSLRTLLIVTVVLSIAFGWLGRVLMRVRHQRQIVAHIESHGGQVQYDYELDPTNERYPNGGPVPPGPTFLRMFLGDDAFAYVEWVGEFESGIPHKHFDLARVAELPRLKHLITSRSNIPDSEITLILRQCELEALTIMNDALSPRGLELLADEKSLTSLGLGGQRSDDASLVAIGRIQQLQSLNVSSVNTTSAGLANIGQLRNLTVLAMHEVPGFDDRVMREVGKLHQLQTLNFRGTSATDEGFRELAGLRELETLWVMNDGISGAGIQHLAGLPRLRKLSLIGDDFDDRSFEAASRIESLEILGVSAPGITDDALTHTQRMKGLRHLYIQRTGITDQGLVHLSSMRNLKSVTFGPLITKPAATELKRALPDCQIVINNGKGSDFLVTAE